MTDRQAILDECDVILVRRHEEYIASRRLIVCSRNINTTLSCWSKLRIQHHNTVLVEDRYVCGAKIGLGFSGSKYILPMKSVDQDVFKLWKKSWRWKGFHFWWFKNTLIYQHDTEHMSTSGKQIDINNRLMAQDDACLAYDYTQDYIMMTRFMQDGWTPHTHAMHPPDIKVLVQQIITIFMIVKKKSRTIPPRPVTYLIIRYFAAIN